jgi:glycosyltransferase involved in cell wall biosynthesis
MFSDRYLATLYRTGRRSPPEVALAIGRRLCDTWRAGRYDAVWLEKELFPWLPGVVESALAAAGTPYVVDYDDAIFHQYDGHRLASVRRLLGAKLTPLVRKSSAVTAGNLYLADWAKRVGASRVEIVPTVVDHRRYLFPAQPPRAGRELRIGWIGTPVTTHYLWQIRGPLRQLARRIPLRLITVGAAPVPGYGVPVEQRDWRWDREAADIASFDIGIMPLRDSPFEQGKCGYKLLQYLACGKPVVASPVGVNVDILAGGGVGRLASDDAQWSGALEELAASAGLRTQMGVNGQRLVQQRYSVEAVAPRVVDLLQRI